MLAPPTTGLGVPAFSSARLAPLMTLVVWPWVLLPRLLSLSALSVAVDDTVVGPGPLARQRKVTSRTSVPPPASVPRLQLTTVAEVAVQAAPAGEADTKVAPAGTVSGQAGVGGRVGGVVVDAHRVVVQAAGRHRVGRVGERGDLRVGGPGRQRRQHQSQSQGPNAAACEPHAAQERAVQKVRQPPSPSHVVLVRPWPSQGRAPRRVES